MKFAFSHRTKEATGRTYGYNAVEAVMCTDLSCTPHNSDVNHRNPGDAQLQGVQVGEELLHDAGSQVGTSSFRLRGLERARSGTLILYPYSNVLPLGRWK